jgi:DNA-binding IclR family transcriptional regulator
VGSGPSAVGAVANLTSKEVTEADAARNGDATRSVVSRTVTVLRAFTIRAEWGVRELAAELGVPKSGLHRTLQELANEGLLRVDDDGTYSVAASLMQLASATLRSVDLTRVAAPYLRLARDEGNETTVLAIYDPHRRQITGVDAAETRHPIQYAWRAMEGWIELHHSASGKGVLAFLDQNEIDEILAEPLTDVAGKPVDRDALRRELKVIRKRGYAATCNSRVAGACGVSAPVRNVNNRVIGAVVIAWPQRRQRDHGERQAQLGELSRRTADAISAELGADAP